VSVGSNLRIEELPYIQGDGRIRLGAGVRFSGKPSIAFGRSFSDSPELLIGDGTFIGHGCAFHIGRFIHIGRNCLLAGGVRVFDMDGHPLDADRRRAGEPTPPEAILPVVIEDDVWIGTSAVILKGVSIGCRSVIAAGAVVTKDIPPDTVAAGNPARVVKHMREV